MTLERGSLARIDRQIFAGLDHADGVRLVRVPLSRAVWSTWRRYCAALGLTMGKAVAGLIVHELQTMVGDATDRGAVVFAGRREEELAVRESQVIDRERDLAATEDRLREWTERLGMWERELQVWERRLAAVPEQTVTTQVVGRKVGRNERCPCGSGLKYKHCHGHPDRLRGFG